MDKSINEELEMLNGNICRMRVYDDEKEFNSMMCFAIGRLEKIYQINFSRLMNKN